MQVDVWAVGVLAYELMMGGATPFFNECTDQTAQLIQKVGRRRRAAQHGCSGWQGVVGGRPSMGGRVGHWCCDPAMHKTDSKR